jgi:serine protease
LFARQADKDFVERGAAGPGWRRTGYAFKGLGLPGPTETRPANQSPVCRYYIPSVNTHFYSALQSECELVRSIGGLFDGVEFWVTRAIDASCPAGTQALTRLYNNRWREMDSNHRYLTSASETGVMQQQGWSNEGVVMCVPL